MKKQVILTMNIEVVFFHIRGAWSFPLSLVWNYVSSHLLMMWEIALQKKNVKRPPHCNSGLHVWLLNMRFWLFHKFESQLDLERISSNLNEGNRVPA